MSDDNPEPRKAKKNKVTAQKLLVGSFSISRLILWIVLAAIIGLIAVEWVTKSNYEATLAKMKKVFPEESAGASDPTEAQVQEAIVGRPAHQKGEGKPRHDTYTWRLLLKSYVIQVDYGMPDVKGEIDPLGFHSVE